MEEVQRSWCKGRSAKAARLSLSVLDKDERRRLLDAWVNAGGGRSSFFASETDAFLNFIAERLPDPSHELTICRMEQGLIRAKGGLDGFDARRRLLTDLADWTVCRGHSASVVVFHAEPSVLLSALGKRPLPPLSPRAVAVVFAPGLDRLSRIATAAEVNVWERLREPATIDALLQGGHPREMIETMFLEGFIDQSA
jgi:hypothetical protein